MTDLSAPIFVFGGCPELTAANALPGDMIPAGSLALTGPGVTAEAGHLPVRGDLAHIKLAGRYFVPHYAVPMPHRIAAGGAALRRLATADAEVLGELPAGADFDVLDISGGWCWGQAESNGSEAGFVGYLPLAAVEPAA